MDNNLAGELCVWKVQHEHATAFLNCLDELLDFSNVFASRINDDFNYLAGIFGLVEFLVHQNNTDNKASASI